MTQKLKDLQNYLEKLNHYRRICTLLSWDMYTATPRQGYAEMSDALTYFSTEEFTLSTSDELYEILKALSEPEEYDTLDEVWKYTVRKMKKDMDENRRVPKDFYASYVAAQSASMKAWEEAKRASDFSLFAPHLQKMIDMTVQMAAYTHPGEETYDVLLDQYEEGVTASDIDRVFGELKEGLVPLVRRILAEPAPACRFIGREFDPDDQKKVQDLLLNYIGFNMEAGYTAQSEHPFTLGFGSHDVRITNHYYPDNPVSAIFSAIHEGGHGIFDQNTMPEAYGTPAASCDNMGIHESQSRFFENILGRRLSFWQPIYPQVQALLPALADIPVEEFVRETCHVQASMIRTEADEVTYPLHVILRYEMEQAIFRDHVPVEQLPELWNRKMEEYLGIFPANDAEGILQDMHWSDGSFGYFPSYLLGSIYDGMFLEAMEAELGSLDEILSRGEILTITRWLNEKIHRTGGMDKPKDIIARVCKKELTAQPLLDYFRNKYLNL